MTQTTTAPKIRAIFMGTSDFAETILLKLIDQEYNIVAVYTQPDKPVGRKQKLQASPVKLLAQQHKIPVEQPEKFDADTVKKLKSYKPDIVVVVAYGKLLPESVLEVPGFGCVNIHPSLLPKFRGPAPIQNALLYGEKETGTTIMLMDEGMDSGDIIAQKKIEILPNDTFPALSEKLAAESAELLIQTLPRFIERQIAPKKQDSSQVTICQLIEREDGRIIWSDEAETIYNKYRALYVWPGLYCFWKFDENQLFRIKLTNITFQKQNPQATHHIGEVFELGEKIGVQTGQGIIFIETLQLEGKKSIPIQEFIKGYQQFIGSVLQ